MIDENQRIAILELAKKGFGTRRIARALSVSRGTVRAVIESGVAKPPKILRPEKAEPYRDEILELYSYCRGNLVRVHEELNKDGAKLSYQALTRFCRRYEIGRAPKVPAGRYDFVPGAEMQHDTSPFPFKIAGNEAYVGESVPFIQICRKGTSKRFGSRVSLRPGCRGTTAQTRKPRTRPEQAKLAELPEGHDDRHRPFVPTVENECQRLVLIRRARTAKALNNLQDFARPSQTSQGEA